MLRYDLMYKHCYIVSFIKHDNCRNDIVILDFWHLDSPTKGSISSCLNLSESCWMTKALTFILIIRLIYPTFLWSLWTLITFLSSVHLLCCTPQYLISNKHACNAITASIIRDHRAQYLRKQDLVSL